MGCLRGRTLRCTRRETRQAGRCVCWPPDGPPGWRGPQVRMPRTPSIASKCRFDEVVEVPHVVRAGRSWCPEGDPDAEPGVPGLSPGLGNRRAHGSLPGALARRGVAGRTERHSDDEEDDAHHRDDGGDRGEDLPGGGTTVHHCSPRRAGRPRRGRRDGPGSACREQHDGRHDHDPPEPASSVAGPPTISARSPGAGAAAALASRSAMQTASVTENQIATLMASIWNSVAAISVPDTAT